MRLAPHRLRGALSRYPAGAFDVALLASETKGQEWTVLKPRRKAAGEKPLRR
jgi:hypothetical protein